MAASIFPVCKQVAASSSTSSLTVVSASKVKYKAAPCQYFSTFLWHPCYLHLTSPNVKTSCFHLLRVQYLCSQDDTQQCLRLDFLISLLFFQQHKTTSGELAGTPEPLLCSVVWTCLVLHRDVYTSSQETGQVILCPLRSYSLYLDSGVEAVCYSSLSHTHTPHCLPLTIIIRVCMCKWSCLCEVNWRQELWLSET